MKNKKKIAGWVGLVGAAGLASSSILPTLIGGSVAPDGKYPATVRIFSGGGSCTATLVGPKVLLTAAHCVADGAQVRFEFKGGDNVSNGCTHHPGYEANQTKDFALCSLSEHLATDWESINTSHSLVKIGGRITLSGYGCTEPGGSGGNDGKLREGYATVTAVPSRNDYDIVTEAATGALCFGDSGGPAFYEVGDNRVVVGVNSRGDIEKTSFLSAVHMVDQNFMKKWADSKGVRICGIHSKCGETPEPKPDDSPDSEDFDWNVILEMLQKIIDLLKRFLAD